MRGSIIAEFEAESAAIAFMQAARQVSAALTIAIRPVKMNYEIHGNSVPHLHMHLFPRYPGELFEGEPIHPRLVKQPIYHPSTSCTFVRPFCMLSKCDGRGRVSDGWQHMKKLKRIVDLRCVVGPSGATLPGVAVSASIRRRASSLRQ